MDERPDHAFYNLSIDAGSMWARRLNDGLIAREMRTIPIAVLG